MIKLNRLRGALLSLFIVAASPALAFQLPGFGGDSGGSSGGQDLQGVINQQDALVQRYLSATKEILTAQKLLSEAFGLKKHAAALDAEIQALSSGSTTQEEIERTQAKSANAQKAIDERMKEGGDLSREGRQKYQESLIPYTTGLLHTSALAPEFSNLLQSARAQIENAPLTQKLEVKQQLDTGVYVATKIPGHISDLTAATKRILTYAKSQKLETAVAEKNIQSLI